MSNIIKLYDAVDLIPEVVSQEIKDYYLNNQSTNIKPLRIRIVATHAGKITRNNGFYLPNKMQEGAATFTSQYPKPIQVHHNDVQDPVGRVIEAHYIDISKTVRDRIADSVTATFDKKLYDFIRGKAKNPVDFVVDQLLKNRALLEDPSYEGLGYIELVAEITDPEAIQKVLDRRYLTGSVGASTNSATCSICKEDWAKSGPCEHKPGKVYDNVKCCLIAGDLEYSEYSFVNSPADRHSGIVEVITDGHKQYIYGEGDVDMDETTQTETETVVAEVVATEICDSAETVEAAEITEVETTVEDSSYQKLATELSDLRKLVESLLVAKTETEQTEKTEEVEKEVVDSTQEQLKVAQSEIECLRSDVENLSALLADALVAARNATLAHLTDYLILSGDKGQLEGLQERVKELSCNDLVKELDCIKEKVSVSEIAVKLTLTPGLANNPTEKVENPVPVVDQTTSKSHPTLPKNLKLQYFDIRLKHGEREAQKFLDRCLKEQGLTV